MGISGLYEYPIQLGDWRLIGSALAILLETHACIYSPRLDTNRFPYIIIVYISARFKCLYIYIYRCRRTTIETLVRDLQSPFSERNRVENMFPLVTNKYIQEDGAYRHENHLQRRLGTDEMFNRHKSSVSPTCMTTRFILLVPPPARNRVEDQQLPFPYFPNNKFVVLLSLLFFFLAVLFFHIELHIDSSLSELISCCDC